MGIVVVIGIVVALIWRTRRRGNPGEPGTDALANRNIAANGGVPLTNPRGGGTSGGPGGYGP